MSDHRVTALAAVLARHEPRSAREAASLRRTRRALEWLDRPFDETADPMHVTGSAIVTSARGDVVLHKHKRVGAWMQPGGHVDAGEEPHEGAVREVAEEVGIAVEHPDGRPSLLHVDVHEGPRGHVHLDLRYLLLADRDAVPDPAPGESPDVAWFDLDAGLALADTSLALALEALADHLTRRTGCASG